MTAVSYQCALKKDIKIGEFLCSHFNIEDGKKSNFFGILCFIISRRVKMQLKRKEKICAVYGEGAGTDRTCQKWFVKFCAGDFLLDDAPRSGRPVEVDSGQIETLIENNQRYTMQEIANILKISKSSIKSHLHQLGYVNRFGVWIPHKLSEKKPSRPYFCVQFSP